MKRLLVHLLVLTVLASALIIPTMTSAKPKPHHHRVHHHCLVNPHGPQGIWTGTSIDRTYARNDGYVGTQLPPYVIKAVAESKGLPGVTMEQITKGESTGRPGMDISDPPGRGIGLYAVNTTWNPHSSKFLRNPINNTEQAADMAHEAGGPNPNIWHGNGYVTSWNLHWDGNPRAIARHLSPVC